jgi:two-component system, LuxR family, response regulator FixJ
MKWIKVNFDSLVSDLTDCESTIFIVDDDESVRRSLKRLLRSVGFRVEVFASARDFLEHGLSDEGLLVLDKQMPEMDGIELQRMLIAAGHRISVIFITAHQDANAREAAIGSGAIAYLEKPFDDQVLLDAIAGWCTVNQSGPCSCPPRHM